MTGKSGIAKKTDYSGKRQNGQYLRQIVQKTTEYVFYSVVFILI